MAKFNQLARQTFQKAAWKLGFHGVLPDRPSTLMVEPTNVCNLRCPACPTGAGTLNRPGRTMTFAEFKGILDQAMNPPGFLKQVTLFNYGEPFLCQDLLKMVRYAADQGLKTLTSTNGHFFSTKQAAADVVASGLSEIIVSLDGADQETISRYRKNANFDQIIEGIRQLLKARKQADRANPVVELQFILMKHNQSQFGRMRQLARELGVDRFVLKTVGISAVDPNFQRLAADLLPEDLSETRYERLPDGAFALKGKPPRNCEYVYSTLVVNSNGDVVPCCYDIHSSHVMGNIFKEPLAAIWRAERFVEFRRNIVTHRGDIAICRHCPERRVPIRRREAVGRVVI